MKQKYQSFESYLEEKCDSHTNNSPEGFERWLENLDTSEIIEYAEAWGKKISGVMYANGIQDANSMHTMVFDSIFHPKIK